MTVTLRFSDDDMALVRRYAKTKGATVSDVIRSAILGEIEDEIDLAAYRKARIEFEADPETVSLDDAERMLLE